MTSKKKYIHYTVPREAKISESWVNSAFSSGVIKQGKSSDDLVDLEKSKIVLDSESGNLRIKSDGITRWFRPSCQCPDCDRSLIFKINFLTKNKRKPAKWIYVCEGFDDNTCKSFFPANITGKLTYEPVDSETRRARKITNDMFQRLWQEAPDILEWAGGDENEMRALINKAKARGYRYLSAKMIEMGHSEGNIPKMDIPTLRVAYSICRDANLSEVMNYS